MDDGGNDNSFQHVSGPAGAIVIDLAARTGLGRALKDSLALETKRAAERAEKDALNKHLWAQQGRDQITAGIRKLQVYESPEAAIRYLKATLLAIDGSEA